MLKKGNHIANQQIKYKIQAKKYLDGKRVSGIRKGYFPYVSGTPFSRFKNTILQLADNQYLAKGKNCLIRELKLSYKTF